MPSETGREIRRALSTDARAICTMWIRSIREICGPLYDNDEKLLAIWCSNKTESQMLAGISDPKFYFIVAVNAAQDVLGVGVLAGSDIRACYLAPEYLHRGIGKQILETLEAEARRQGVTKLKLGSTRYAVSFYQRNGFQLQGEGEVTGPNLLPYFPMEKILSEPEGA